MKLFIMFLQLMAIAVVVVIAESMAKGVQGTCQCAAFKAETDGAGEPLISKTPGFKVDCDPEGNENCKKMCIALAQASKEKVPKALCEIMKGHVQDLKPSAFYKACDGPEWIFTGLTAAEPICCHEGVPTHCT